MPRHNRRPQRSKRTHYWQKHHLKHLEEPKPEPQPQEILISVRISPRTDKNPHNKAL